MSQSVPPSVLEALSQAAERPLSPAEIIQEDGGHDPELGHCISYIVELDHPGHRLVFPVWKNNPDPEDMYEAEDL